MRRTTMAVLTVAALVALGGAAQADWNAGLAAFKAGNYAAAAQEFSKNVEEQPDWPGGHYMLGWTYLKQKKNQEAVAHLRKAYELQPGNLAYQLRLGEAYVATGRYGDAAAFLGKIDESKLPADQRSFLSQLKAVALTKTGQDASALQEMAKAARAKPNDAQAQYQYGTAAYNAGNTADAVDALGKAARLDAGDPDKHSAYVKALNRQGRESRGSAKISAYTKAIDAAKKLVALNASYDNLMLLGEAQLGAKEYDGAVGSFGRAADKNVNDWLSHFYIGQAYTAKQQYKSAESSLKQAMDKTSNPADNARIWRQLGFVYEKLKSYDAAIAAYTRAGDTSGAQRAQENKETAEYNEQVEAEARRLQEMQAEQERIRKELEELNKPGGGGKKDGG